MKFCPQCRTDMVNALIDGEERLACADVQCGFVHWNNPVPVVAAIVEYGDSIVLAHNVQWPEGMFSVITGFVEQGEDPQEGVLREVQEELGLNGFDPKLVGVYPFPQMNQVIIAYHVRAAGEIKLNHELDATKLVPVDELQGWEFGTGLAVKDFVAARNSNA
ncbi:NUDIX domain-containing protein [Pseudoteredinibacter isoporae]|uniref:NADH pyrophosphatase NudC (Nudix superfamily) n=1 Tax=Pseudoteredinibacter isoporae TaxID=570281 RepID=A0A7X0JVT8_9GAMM|nr:NUDIX domain-containing protein [Pseudoteredinibacter isoporae]MBB6523168.1 NADH pyrophosphatase NudC (nudix superfamily) [Pseudoteredinibacter isoporae]NHO88687.1 NUDIX domain-containing protein [Pseudoteredinibacter isoporae]NIB22622.1 NUDIX domain-containing protein [Pseudoteredinibacter isoporae]